MSLLKLVEYGWELWGNSVSGPGTLDRLVVNK